MTEQIRIQRIRHALTIAPGLVEHIVSMRGSSSRSNGPRVQTSKEPPAPMNVGAVDDADYVYRALAYWTGVYAARFGVDKPPLLRRARRLADGAVDGYPADITPRTARTATFALTRWMLEEFDRITETSPLADVEPLAGDADVILTLAARWAVEDDATTSQVPCPTHGAPVRLYPPLEFGMDRVIVCDRSCYFTEDRFALITREHIDRVREEVTSRRRATRIMNDLTKRYANVPLSRNAG